MGFDLITLSMAKAYSDSKGGYVEKNWKTILSTEGNTIPFAVKDGFGSYETETNDGRELKQISNGDICKVVLDGTEYVLSAVVDSIDIYIGNSEGTEDGVPFLFWFTNMEETWRIVINVMGEEPEHSFALYLQTETIVPIDPKYLPGPKVIDLTQYELGDENSSYRPTINDAVLAAFAGGGGTEDMIDNSTFWDDVYTDRPLLFVIDAKALGPSIKIEAGANSVMWGDDAVVITEFAFLVNVDGWSKVTVVFGDNGDGTTKITVVVDPLTIPGA